MPGEILYGQIVAGASAPAFLEIQDFLSHMECLTPNDTTCLIYARIRAAARKQGITLPEPDYWIAAHAIQENIPLVTTDSDFKMIPGLRALFIKK